MYAKITIVELINEYSMGKWIKIKEKVNVKDKLKGFFGAGEEVEDRPEEEGFYKTSR